MLVEGTTMESNANKRERMVGQWLRGYYSKGELFRGELKCHEEEMSFRCDVKLHRLFQSAVKCFITLSTKGKIAF